jgi:hypothetical protein
MWLVRLAFLTVSLRISRLRFDHQFFLTQFLSVVDQSGPVILQRSFETRFFKLRSQIIQILSHEKKSDVSRRGQQQAGRTPNKRVRNMKEWTYLLSGGQRGLVDPLQELSQLRNQHK